MFTRCVFVFGFLGLLSHHGVGGDGKKDQDLIQGSWKIVKLEVQGKVAGKLFKGGKYVFKGKEVTIFEGDKEVAKGTFVLDPDKKPKAIDIKGTEGQLKGKTVLGLYRIEGNTLVLCSGDERPKELSGAGKAGLLQFEKVKSD